MRDNKSLSHTRWDCEYHIAFIPKRRQKAIFGGLRRSRLQSTLGLYKSK
jgi:putative transposase